MPPTSTSSTTVSMLFFFFFQAEDGIRYKLVTGVQTCALPISTRRSSGTGRTASPSRCRTMCRGSSQSRQARPTTSPSPATASSTFSTASSTERGSVYRGRTRSARSDTSCSTRRWCTWMWSTQACRTREGVTSPSRCPRRVKPRRSAVLTTEGGAAAFPSLHCPGLRHHRRLHHDGDALPFLRRGAPPPRGGEITATPGGRAGGTPPPPSPQLLPPPRVPGFPPPPR